MKNSAVFDVLIANASPLIFLSHVAGIEWLGRLATVKLLVPDAVLAEIEAGSGGGELAAKLRKNSMCEVISDIPVPIVVAAWDLGVS